MQSNTNKNKLSKREKVTLNEDLRSVEPNPQTGAQQAEAYLDCAYISLVRSGHR